MGAEDSSASARLGGHLHLKRFRQFWESELHAPRWLLSFLEDDYKLPFESAPGQVAPDVIFRLELAAGPLMGLGAIVAIAFYSRYSLSSARHQEIVSALKQRNSESRIPPADVPAEAM